jgi:proline iminopeptidase
MFPAIEPFATGTLAVADGNEIYWEASGNPDGKPALHLHGGPGSGIKSGYRRRFDPTRYLIVGFDPHGCGRSRPLATDSPASLVTNTTHGLIADIEELRAHLRVEKWLLSGVSWGSTLALAYAQAHPDRVSEIILTAVTTTSYEEVRWITEDVGRIFPREWERFASIARPGQRVIDAYYEHITSPSLEIREAAARAWCTWEDVHVSLASGAAPDPRYEDPDFRMLLATLVIHYWKHAAFLPDGLLAGMNKIAHVPGALIHGRLDVSGPLITAWELHKVWPASELVVINDEGHGGAGMVEALVAAGERFARL